MNDVRVDPRRLKLLLELSRLGSMREVAEATHVTTSTVSQQIAALAREAGAPLIEPDGRRVRLTPAGRRLAGQQRSERRRWIGGKQHVAHALAGIAQSLIGVANLFKLLRRSIRWMLLHFG